MSTSNVKWLAVAVMILAPAITAHAGIVLTDASPDFAARTPSGYTDTFSAEVNSGTDLLILTLSGEGHFRSYTPLWNAVPMIEVGHEKNADDGFAAMYYLVNPAIGTHNFATSFDEVTANSYAASWTEWSGVDTTNPLHDSASGNGDQYLTNSIDAVEGGLLIDIYENKVTNATTTPLGSATSIFQVDGSSYGAHMASSYVLPSTTATGVTMGYADDEADFSALVTASFNPIPEPSTLSLLALGLLGLLLVRRRRRA